MVRLFETSTKRNIKELSQKWRLIPDFDKNGDEKGYQNGLPTDARYTFVPSCWNFELDLFHHEGTTWYETEFEATEDNVILVFGAVNNFCDVYVDGKHVAYHYGAFCEFTVDLPNIKKGRHLLVVKVGAELNMLDSVPSLNTDWFNYGGIIRAVEVHSVKACKLNFYTNYDLDVENKSAILDVNTEIKLYAPEISDTFKIKIDGKTVYEEELKISDIANRFGYHKDYLSKIFNAGVGCGFNQYVNILRVKYAKGLIVQGELTLDEIGTASGFQSDLTFRRAFVDYYGQTPREYRKNLSYTNKKG